LPFSHEGNDSRNGNPKTAKTRNSPHLAGIGRDPLELHVDSVARSQLICERRHSGSHVRQGKPVVLVDTREREPFPFMRTKLPVGVES